MKRSALYVIFALLLLPLVGQSAIADEPQTLNGEYVWSNRDMSGDLKAVFTPTGEGTWDVVFYFKFRGEPHEYTGTAEGSLTDGALKGTVKNENQKRTWNFWGDFENGKFSGDHEEITPGRERKTGTLTLS